MADGQYFDPQTGNSYNFGPGQQPPAEWKELKTVSDSLPGVPPRFTVAWLPGREPRLFVDPASGESRWIRSLEEEPKGWLPLRPLMLPPSPNGAEQFWFDPLTGESCVFGPDPIPPDGWKKLKPIPSRAPLLPLGSTAAWLKVREAGTYVNPDNGDVQWADPVKGPPAGWIALQLRFKSPPPSEIRQDYFDPATGESDVFQLGEEPPPQWKKLRPTPPQVSGLSPFSTVTWLPGCEPILYVDPSSGEQIWVGPPTKPPAPWIELRPRFEPPHNPFPAAAE